MTEPVPFLDLNLQHEPLRAAMLDAIGAVIDESAFAGGAAVERFEREWAAFSGVPHAVGLSNGTDALEVALRALDLPAGSMGPKVEAGIAFAEHTGKPAAIGRLAEIGQVIAGERGTRIEPAGVPAV